MKLTGQKDITGRLVCDGDTLLFEDIFYEVMQREGEWIGWADPVTLTDFTQTRVIQSRDLPSPGRV